MTKLLVLLSGLAYLNCMGADTPKGTNSPAAKPTVRVRLLNKDGRPDLVVGQFGYLEGEIRWMENLGNWQFKSHQLLDLPGTIHAPVADLTGSGNLDVVALVSQDAEEVHAFAGDGAGHFRDRVLYGSTNKDFGSSGLSIADVNRDGRPDIVYTNGDGFDYATPGAVALNGSADFAGTYTSSAGQVVADSQALQHSNPQFTKVNAPAGAIGVTVGEVMNPKPTTVPATISLQQLVDAYFLPGGLRYALVMQADHLVGLMTLSDIRHTPREQWRQTPVGHAMTPLERLHVVSPQQNIKEVVPLMVAQDVNQLAVVQEGRLVGVLSREDIMRSLQIRQDLGLDKGGK